MRLPRDAVGPRFVLCVPPVRPPQRRLPYLPEGDEVTPRGTATFTFHHVEGVARSITMRNVTYKRALAIATRAVTRGGDGPDIVRVDVEWTSAINGRQHTSPTTVSVRA